MSPSTLPIVHIVGPDIDAVRAEVLGTLLDRLPAAHRLVLLGTPPLSPPAGIPLKRIPALSHVLTLPLSRVELAGDAARVIVHAWSGRALTFAQAQCTDADGLMLLSEAQAHFEAPNLAPDSIAAFPMGLVARSAREAARLTGKVCATEHIVIIRSGVDFAALDPARRSQARAALDLEPSDIAVLILPPVTRASGGYAAVWGALVAQRVCESVRLIVPGQGSEVDRIARFVDSAQRRATLRLTGDRHSLAELLVACDVAAYLPAGEVGVDSLAWAMAAGRPILASATPSVTELLVHGSTSWLCAANDPKDVARLLLEIMDGGPEVRERCEAARGRAHAVYSQERMIEQYAAVYANLAAGRPVGVGVADAADPVRA